ncbi:acyl-CoA dehydrogenase family protein [Sinomonas sp. JGH33]|uniref:Acyl-CoA dehydrogenase family protein n=1 Tax=Sinomonas terricola TaxID=3110330 RepID=A0ABU5T111_9MICC|nr:acyl-CoA dehydrogenase family protein [Sinomonas sp. JGH33]MEA5453358.1 acyl-CoA dehydrogenase family protein [Sinomonas sp. JGH33]
MRAPSANQPPPRVGIDEFSTNTGLVDGVRRYGAGWAAGALAAVGRLVGSAEFQENALLANTHVPELRALDRYGERRDEVEYHPAYHRVLGDAVAHGAHTSAWADPRPGAHVARAAAFMLFAQVEPGHACPVSMTHAAVPALAREPAVARVWLPRLYGTGYEPRLMPAADKPGALMGMAMTERQGGSDVRANTTAAVDAGGGTALITGHKWFCSAPMSDAFLVLAQEPAGPSCFLVPRVLDDGSLNPFRLVRLKAKLGNRSNASAEVEFEDTLGWRVGEAGRGVRAIIGMVHETRLDCVLGSAAGMRQGVVEAVWHARHRRAFGRLLADQPAMASVLADLALEAEAATWLGLRLAAADDGARPAPAGGAAPVGGGDPDLRGQGPARGGAGPHLGDVDGVREQSFARIATAVAKFWVCQRGPAHAAEALECLGGNGYTEDFPLAMRYREQPVMAIWEGSGNVVALDVLRALERDPDSAEALADELEQQRGVDPVLDAQLGRALSLMSDAAREPGEADAWARRLAEELALALQGALLVANAPSYVAEAFIAARLGEKRTLGYGSLPDTARTEEILARV